jgi:hypothetical protein
MSTSGLPSVHRSRPRPSRRAASWSAYAAFRPPIEVTRRARARLLSSCALIAAILLCADCGGELTSVDAGADDATRERGHPLDAGDVASDAPGDGSDDLDCVNTCGSCGDAQFTNCFNNCEGFTVCCFDRNCILESDCTISEDIGDAAASECYQCNLQDLFYANCLHGCCEDGGIRSSECLAACGSSCSSACNACTSELLEDGAQLCRYLGACG